MKLKGRLELAQIALRLGTVSILLAPHPSAASPWALDPNFGTRGVVTTSIDESLTQAFAVVVRPDGRLVVGGSTYKVPMPTPTPLTGPITETDFMLAQYEPDGDLDLTFGLGGIATNAISSYDDVALALLLLPDGRLVQAGSSAGHMALARYDATGRLDGSFSNDGVATFQEGGEILALAGQGEKLIVAAAMRPPLFSVFAVGRVDSSGGLDHSFGDGGWAIHPPTSDLERATAVVVQEDGKPVAAGVRCQRFTCDLLVNRYKFDGGLDPDFADQGTAIIPLGKPWGVARLALLPNGKLVAGTVDNLWRFDSDGHLDLTFGSNGSGFTTLPEAHFADALLAWPDGRIIGAGVWRPDEYDIPYDFSVQRFDRNGALDLSFTPGGAILEPAGTAHALARTPDGKLVVAGEIFMGPLDWNVRIARYASAADCGNGFVETGEDCDALDDSACPGGCLLDQCLCSFSPTRVPTATRSMTSTPTLTEIPTQSATPFKSASPLSLTPTTSATPFKSVSPSSPTPATSATAIPTSSPTITPEFPTDGCSIRLGPGRDSNESCVAMFGILLLVRRALTRRISERTRPHAPDGKVKPSRLRRG